MADKKVEEEFAGYATDWFAGLFGQCWKEPSTEDDLKFGILDKKQRKEKKEKKEKKSKKQKDGNTPEQEVAASVPVAEGTPCKTAKASSSFLMDNTRVVEKTADEQAPQPPMEADKSSGKACDKEVEAELAVGLLAGTKLAEESEAAEPMLKPQWFTQPSIGTWLMVLPKAILEPAVLVEKQWDAAVVETNLPEKLEVAVPAEPQLVQWYHLPSVGTWVHRVAPVKCTTVDARGAKSVENEQDKQSSKFTEVTNQDAENMLDVDAQG